MKRPIIEALIKYINRNDIPFSMPGHKMGRGFDEELRKILLYGDITEIDGLDNLHNPSECIKESLVQLSKLYESYKSYFLINGSSSGNLIMLNAFFNKGDKILVERNCHKSITNGIIMRELNPVYIKNEYSKNLNIYGGINYKEFTRLLETEKDIKGIVITYPNYYGICCDLQKIIVKCKQKNILVLVDCAHGAHFLSEDRLPEDPIKLGADCVVMSAHKTLPSLTQTSYMHLNNKSYEKKIDLYFSILSSTSPSYLFMASLEYAYTFLAEKGNILYSDLIENIEILREYISNNSEIKILDNKIIKSEFGDDYCIDNSRIVLNLKNKFNGQKLYKYLKDMGIQAEMYDESNVVLITTPFNYKEEIEYLRKCLINLSYNKIEGKVMLQEEIEIPKRILAPYEVIDKRRIKVKIENSENRICADNITPYPPGIPLLVAGEKITKKEIDKIYFLKLEEVDIIGIDEESIYVVEE